MSENRAARLGRIADRIAATGHVPMVGEGECADMRLLTGTLYPQPPAEAVEIRIMARFTNGDEIVTSRPWPLAGTSLTPR